MDAKAASVRQKRQRFQCGRGCGKGQAAPDRTIRYDSDISGFEELSRWSDATQ
jgi:hypothetical protein